jgi:uncharacterized membrane protein YphA (DoxX/SURF4 family)
MLAPAGGMPEVLAFSTGLLELLGSCGVMLGLLAPWEVKLVGRFFTSGSYQPPADFSAAEVT